MSFLPSSHSCVYSADIHAAGSADGGRRSGVKKRRIHVNQPQLRTSSIFPGSAPAPAPHLSTWQCLDHHPLDPSEDGRCRTSKVERRHLKTVKLKKGCWFWTQWLGCENLHLLSLQRVFQSMSSIEPRFPQFTLKKQLRVTVSKKNLWNNDGVTDEVTILAAGNELPLGQGQGVPVRTR